MNNLEMQLLKNTQNANTVQPYANKKVHQAGLKVIGALKVTGKKQEKTIRNWELFKQVLTEDVAIDQEVQNEKIALAEAILRVQKFVTKEYAKDLTNKPDFFNTIKKFINFLQYASDDSSNKQTIISLLSVLKKIVQTNENGKNNEMNQEEQVKQKQKIQNMFDQLGSTKMVLTVISENSKHLDSELIIHFISFVNCLLDGGNNAVQKTIYNFFINYQKSEVLFFKFSQIIRNQIKIIEQRAINIQNNENEENELENKEQLDLLEVVLKFLQLCVEGHYLPLQNYFQKQENSRNNYDMVNLVADLLKAYYYGDCTQTTYDNMINCLDTLSEFVQGPCKENQDAVSDSKFFDIASDLFLSKPKKSLRQRNQEQMNQEELKKNKKKEKKIDFIEIYRQSKNEPLTKWMIVRLQNKVLVLVLSILESRDIKNNCDIIKRIMRNLPLHTLQRHFIKTYGRFFKYNAAQFDIDSLHHLDRDPRNLDDQKFFQKLYSEKKSLKYVDLYLSTVLQNGFYIYFLISQYVFFFQIIQIYFSQNIKKKKQIKADQNLPGEIVRLFQKHENKILNKKKGDIEDLLTGDNIIGQLISFSRSLIESVLNYMQQVQQMSEQAAKKLQKTKISSEEQKQELEKKATERKTILKKAVDFFAQNTSHIDIFRNEQLELVYFIRLPFILCLPKEQKINFHQKCDRTNIKSKQLDLIKEASEIIEICRHEYRLKKLFQTNKLLALFANYVKLWKDLSFLFGLTLNIIIFFSFATSESSTLYQRIMEDYQLFQQTQYTREFTRKVFNILGILMLVCKVLYYLTYSTLAIIATFVHPFFFTFHLSEVLLRYPTLKNVIMSIYLPRRQLLLTFLLLVIAEYIFTIFAYTFYNQDYMGNCSSMLYCFLFTFDQTFKANGGVGGYLAETTGQKNTAQFNFSRFFFDNLSQYVLVTIMINIVSGIIIDNFGILRDKQNEKNQDMNNYCFICGIEKLSLQKFQFIQIQIFLRTTFDRKSDSGAGFQKHIKLNHYMWNYIYFMAYLEWKNKNEYTGIESYVDQLLKDNDTYWMPFKKARELTEGDDDDEQIDLTKLKEIIRDQNIIQRDLDIIQEVVEKFNKEKRK
ncbi:MIR domain protein [Ichthyophthirius multifiliis]|uniref:MIR domain protein n=1 Tax=Ichthyophthirius multifiliis TaxID=5932 RepID=G0QPW0_ICHMU|nr:MIR domain protein [Ichthyophthirius multifiliis]EGR32738.1 MIR domain protein [Ichthyophthirius multifiliis]|eukprot:XP_004036724.1 MIR domain protein [Ichthyophthirius multifiliis]